MARPVTTSEAQSKRTVSVTFATVAEKQQWQEHAKKRGTNLANLLKMLLASDMANTLPAPTSSRE